VLCIDPPVRRLARRLRVINLLAARVWRRVATKSTVCVKKSLLSFSDIFPKRLGIFSRNFTCLLCVPIYAGLQIFIQLSATLTKLYHIKRDHHNVLKMSTIDRNERLVVALNMA